MIQSRKFLLSIFFLSLILILAFVQIEYGLFSKADSVETLYKTCLKKMEDKTCSILTGPELNILPTDSQSILIAGFGEMDINLYKGLRSNPLYMCQNIQLACKKGSDEDLCRLGKTLYK